MTPEPLQILEGPNIPFLSIHTVRHLLQNLERFSSGRDNMPYWFWKSYALELAPSFKELFNVSSKTTKVLPIWKFPNLLRLPKLHATNYCPEKPWVRGCLSH